MRFSPKTEEEVSNLLAEGVYPFEVLEAAEKQSKAGNDMIALKLGIVGPDDSKRAVFDYLLTDESAQYKLRHFSDTVGLLAEYEKGALTADNLVGLTGKCKLVIQPAKDGYDAKNSVRDYVKRGAKDAAPVKGSSAAKNDMDDDIPFAPCFQ